MKNWYNTLAPREQSLVFYGSLVSIALLFWMLIIDPLMTNHTKLNKVISTQQETLEKMQVQRVQIKQLQQNTSQPASNSNTNPQQLVERSLQTWRLKPQLERMQSQGAKSVRLSLKNVNADRAIRFLYELEDKYSLSITSLVINNDKNEVGFADIRLTVKRN